MQRIIIDTDPGKDDFLAIMLLIMSKQVNIEAITTVMGNSSIQNVTANARYLLDLTASPIPLFAGSSRPLKTKLVLGKVMGTTGLDGLEIPKVKNVSKDAVEQIVKLVTENPGEISILSLGPQTNIAKALLYKPGLEKKIKSIVFMGGAISVPGNMNRVAEFNFYVDPVAAKIVMESSIPKVMFPLDVCYQVPLYMKDFSKLKNSKFGNIIKKLMKPYIEALAKYDDQPGAIVYDALAAYYLLNPNSFELTPMDVVVETKGTFTKGMSVINKSSAAVPNILVATSVKSQEFKNDFIKIIKSIT